jgi:hypothetical protein
LVSLASAAGCASGPTAVMPNPVDINGVAYETVWNQTVDVVNDYFIIERESRVDGRIETVPTVGSTLLEPWNGDAVGFDERLEGTLQSIRRRAFVQVAPVEGGFLVSLEVFKELEDMKKPQFADAGQAIFRHNASPSRDAQVVTEFEAPEGWIPVGRDFALENQILWRIRDVLTRAPR